MRSSLTLLGVSDDDARAMMEHEQDRADLRAALEAATKRIADLEAQVAANAKAPEPHAPWILELLDSAGVGVWEWDMASEKNVASDALLAMFGVERSSFCISIDTFIGLVHEDDRAAVTERVEHVFSADSRSYFNEFRVVRPDGEVRSVKAHGLVFRDAAGKPCRFASVLQDVTEQKREEAERTAMQQQIIDAQRENLKQLGAPIIPLAANTLAMPLVGALTPERATLVTETLLHAVTDRAAEFVILDVTGVPAVDTDVADGLLRVAQAVRLLGAEVALTGMQPGVARALVELGVDMSAFVTKADLQGGIAWARKNARR